VLLTQAAADVADLAYAPAIDPAWSQGACEPIGPQPATPTPQPSQPEAVVPVARPAFTG
jgi:hypothetical protein